MHRNTPEAKLRSPAWTQPFGKASLGRLQQLARHRKDFIKSFQAGAYFRGAEKIKLGWSLAEFAADNEMDLQDPAVQQRYELLLRDARADFKRILDHLRKVPVEWASEGAEPTGPHWVIESLPLSCDFVIPTSFRGGATSYPSPVFRGPKPQIMPRQKRRFSLGSFLPMNP